MNTSQIVDNRSPHTNNVYVASLSEMFNEKYVDENMLYNNLDGSDKRSIWCL